MLGDLFGKLDDTLLGSDVTLNRNHFTSLLTLFGGSVDLLSCGFEHVISSTVDDHLNAD